MGIISRRCRARESLILYSNLHPIGPVRIPKEVKHASLPPEAGIWMCGFLWNSCKNHTVATCNNQGCKLQLAWTVSQRKGHMSDKGWAIYRICKQTRRTRYLVGNFKVTAIAGLGRTLQKCTERSNSVLKLAQRDQGQRVDHMTRTPKHWDWKSIVYSSFSVQFVN